MKTWYMGTLDKAPSMDKTIVALDVASYDEAKETARKWAADNGRSATVHSKPLAIDAWFYVDGSGHGFDRNTGRGELRF